jgi:hypothetical protein
VTDPVTELTFPPNWHHDPAKSTARRGEKPGRPFVVTVSEIQAFRRCEGAWDFTSANRKSLQRVGMPTPALNIGSAVHYALARQNAGHNWLEAVNEHYAATKSKVEREYHERVGTGLSHEETVLLSQQRWEAQRLLEAYFARYGTEWPTKPYRIVAAEVTFGVMLVPDQNIWLMGTLDRIYADKFGNAIPGEIKTYKSSPDRTKWRFNFQCYMYACALGLLLDTVPPLFLYDGMRKKGPTEPLILKKSGKVSKRWIDTTYDEYIRVVRHAHRGKVPEEYYDILKRLMARDQSPENAFTTRFRIPLVQSAMALYWDEAAMTAKRMLHAYQNITFNKDWQGCPMCRVKDLCDARLAGEDLAGIVARNYEVDVSPTRKATRFITPKKLKEMGGGLEALAEFSRDQPTDPLREHALVGDTDD